MKKRSLEAEIEIVEFAKKHEKVEAVYFGNFPDLDGNPMDTYMVLTKSPVDFDFFDEVVELDLSLFNRGYNVDILNLPFGCEEKDERAVCIYQK